MLDPSMKDVVLTVAALAGMVTGTLALVISAGNLVVVIKNFLVNHPSHKGIVERELGVYDALDDLDAALSPLLTKSKAHVEAGRTALEDVRDRLKTLASGVFCPEQLRTELYALVAHLRDVTNSDEETVSVPTEKTRDFWQRCKDVARRRVREFVSYDEPHLLFKATPSGLAFVSAFRTRWQRKRFVARHPGTTYTYWQDGEKPPLLRRLLT